MLVDLDRSCRLCFQSAGEKDVTAAPEYLRIIKDLYNVDVSSIQENLSANNWLVN